MMNQRLETLIDEADEWADAQNFYASEHRDYLMERFAKLVVDESLRVLGERMGYTEFNATKHQLYLHFGVNGESKD
ncbi:MAG: hypothetical protein EBX72_13225 [Betaproteobacteria bacterium]|nr:hypothetical protein [Betaproteobacteria bacterium]